MTSGAGAHAAADDIDLALPIRANGHRAVEFIALGDWRLFFL